MRYDFFASVNWKEELISLFYALLGTAIMAAGINLFVVPEGLYTGGLLGFCQLFRTLINRIFSLEMNGFDYSGILYYLLNIPIFILAFLKLGKHFLVRTVICVTSLSALLSIIPIPEQPLLMKDPLAECLIGGMMSGFGIGVALSRGSSTGGMDIVELYMVKYRGVKSIGHIDLAINLVLFAICLFLFDIQTVIYSVLFTCVNSIMIDRMHKQNINMQVLIVTGIEESLLREKLLYDLDRGFTYWEAKGGYLNRNMQVYCVILSKYEIEQLKRIMRELDPNAFLIMSEGIEIEGNFLKKL